MKKVLLVGLFLIGSMNLSNAGNLEATTSEECFEVAIGALVDMENELGFTLNDSDATEFMNDRYMLCWCLYNIEFCLSNW